MTTMNELLQAALACQTREEASAWFNQQVDALAAGLPLVDRETVADNLSANLGYETGYHGLDVAERLYELFAIEHPYFGTPYMRSKMSFEDIYAAGVYLAEHLRDAPS